MPSQRPRRRQQPSRATPPSGFLNTRIIGAGVAVAILLVGAVILFTIAGGGSDPEEPADSGATIGEEHRVLPPELIDGFALGSPDAPLLLTVFEDFQCPYCISFATTVEPVLIDEFIATGQLRLEFRNLPILGSESGFAATGSVCAARENRFWDYAGSIFALQVAAGQISNERINVGRLGTDALIEIAGQSGLETTPFESCLASADALSEVQEHIDAATSFGLRGTPSFILDGVPLQSPPDSAEGWRTLLNERLAPSE